MIKEIPLVPIWTEKNFFEHELALNVALQIDVTRKYLLHGYILGVLTHTLLGINAGEVIKH